LVAILSQFGLQREEVLLQIVLEGSDGRLAALAFGGFAQGKEARSRLSKELI
jgi:hypothetical protein